MKAPPTGRPRPSTQGRRRPGSWKKPQPGQRTTERRKLPRTFNRKPAQWLQVVFDLPDASPDALLSIRRDALNLSREDACRVLRISRNTLWDWETGRRRPPYSAYLALRCLAENVRRSTVPIDPAHDITAPDPGPLAAMLEAERTAGERGRVRLLQERMRAFTSIYNAAWLVRDSWYGPTMRRQESVWVLVTTLIRELRQCADFEGLLYALADALTASPRGVPWQDGSERSTRRARAQETGTGKVAASPAPDHHPSLFQPPL